MTDWGSCYLDHFEKYLKKPQTRNTFDPHSEHDHSIQVLGYDGVFSGCRVFASLGLSHYPDSVGQVCEVVLPIDGGWDDAPKALANVLFYCVQQEMRVQPGLAVSGISRVFPQFAAAFGKEAMYFAQPYPFPKGFEDVRCGDAPGKVYLAIMITRAEFSFLHSNGAQRLEQILEQKKVDPFTVHRPSTV